jgi:hypothetical protein
MPVEPALPVQMTVGDVGTVCGARASWASTRVVDFSDSVPAPSTNQATTGTLRCCPTVKVLG